MLNSKNDKIKNNLNVEAFWFQAYVDIKAKRYQI